jgi:hypothetical protein
LRTLVFSDDLTALLRCLALLVLLVALDLRLDVRHAEASLGVLVWLVGGRIPLLRGSAARAAARIHPGQAG